MSGMAAVLAARAAALRDFSGPALEASNRALDLSHGGDSGSFKSGGGADAGAEQTCPRTPTRAGGMPGDTATSSGMPLAKAPSSKPLRSLRKTVAKATGLSGFFSRKSKRATTERADVRGE